MSPLYSRRAQRIVPSPEQAQDDAADTFSVFRGIAIGMAIGCVVWLLLGVAVMAIVLWAAA